MSTQMSMSLRRLAGWERRLRPIEAAVPYLTLGLSAVLDVLVRDPAWPPLRISLTLAALAGAWVFGMTRVSRSRGNLADRPVLRTVYVVVLLGLIAALIVCSPFYAFFAFTGYLHSAEYLPGGWKFVGITATAFLMAIAQVGGFFTLPLLPYLAIALLNTVLASTFTYLGWLSIERAEQRKQVIAELEATNSRLEATLTENAALHVQLLAQAREAGVLDEPQRMARELHDTLAQGLTGIITQLEAADAADGQSDARRRHLDTARALARESLSEARRSVDALRPEPLEQAHLPDAVTDLAKRWAETSGVSVGVELTGVPRPLVADVEVALFRVAQEALTNVGKHAAATKVGITLSYMDDVVVLDVRDDGRGFPAADDDGRSARGFGLAAMEQRVRQVSGTLEVESSPEDGTALSASVPAIPAQVQVHS